MASGPGTAYVIIKASNRRGNAYGQGNDCYLFGDNAGAKGHVFAAAAAAFGNAPLDAMRNFDHIGMQLITENITSAPVVIGASDTAVVASTKTWTIPGYDFTGQVGATIHVSGDVAHTGNNGAFVVSSVTSAHVVVTTTASGLANETFDPATTTITVERTDAPLTGAWTVTVSNDFVPASNGSSYGQSPQSGHFTDITAGFVDAAGDPAIAPVTDESNQYVQADLDVRALVVTFTPTP